MATKPTEYPEWCINPAIVDATSGELNVVEPSTGKKTTGFLFSEKPPRQDFNWLHYISNLWTEWFDQQEQDHETRIAANETSVVPLTNLSDQSSTAYANILQGLLANTEIVGYKMSRASATQLTVDPGRATLYKDYASVALTDFYLAFNQSGITKTLTQLLSEASISLAADAWYHIFVCVDSTAPSTPTIFADSAINASQIRGAGTYDTCRRIGSILTDGSMEITPFTQFGDRVLWDTPVSISTTTTVGVQSSATVSPLGVSTTALINAVVTGSATNSWKIWDGILGSGITSTNARRTLMDAGGISGAGDWELITDTSQRVYYDNVATVTVITMRQSGYIDPRGRKGYNI